MIDMTVNFEGDGAFKDFHDKKIRHIIGGIRISALAGGMVSGKPSVVFGFDIGDGEVVLAETSLALLLTSADMLRARFGDPRFGTPPGPHNPPRVPGDRQYG